MYKIEEAANFEWKLIRLLSGQFSRFALLHKHIFEKPFTSDRILVVVRALVCVTRGFSLTYICLYVT